MTAQGLGLLARRRDDVAAALMLLTRLPAVLPNPGDISYSRTVWTFPLVGALIGGVGALTALAAAWLRLPPLLVATAVVAAQLLATGALHEDGLADTADGLGGGRTRARKLEIMHDSRVGAYGAIALIVALLARVAAIAAILASERDGAAALIVAGALGRGAMLLPIAILDPALEGLASGLVGRTRTALVAGAGLTLLAAWVGPHRVGLYGLCGAAAAGLAMTDRMRRHLGGYVGDTLGATCVVAECCALAGMAAALAA